MWRQPGGAIGWFVSHGEGVIQNRSQDYPNLGDMEILISQKMHFNLVHNDSKWFRDTRKLPY